MYIMYIYIYMCIDVYSVYALCVSVNYTHMYIDIRYHICMDYVRVPPLLSRRHELGVIMLVQWSIG